MDFSKDVSTAFVCYGIIFGDSTNHSSQTKFSIYPHFVMVALQLGLAHALHL